MVIFQVASKGGKANLRRGKCQFRGEKIKGRTMINAGQGGPFESMGGGRFQNVKREGQSETGAISNRGGGGK